MKISSSSVFDQKKVLVTGHTGFKGSWLSVWLCALGAKVTGFSSDVPSGPSHFQAAKLTDKLTDYRGDIRDFKHLSAVVKDTKPDFVFHLAAQPLVRRSYVDPLETWSTNTLGTVNVLESLRTIDHPCVAIFITSDKAYDNKEWTWGYRENDDIGGLDPYSASKGGAELALRSYIASYFQKQQSLRIGIARAGNVIGGGDWADDRIVPDLIRAWQKDDVLELRYPGATRPWQHVLEPLGGYLALAKALYKEVDLHGEAFNFGPSQSQNKTVGELVAVISEAVGHEPGARNCPDSSGFYESGLLKLNCDKALHLLNWEASWGFRETALATANWYKSYYRDEKQSIFDFSCSQIISYLDETHCQTVKDISHA
jgi:CDP-glucose 4,6-dehydratase